MNGAGVVEQNWNRLDSADAWCPVTVIRDINPGARRPAGKARRARIPGVFEREATPPDGMPRPGVMSRITVTGH
jgi:hypothetical protein